MGFLSGALSVASSLLPGVGSYFDNKKNREAQSDINTQNINLSREMAQKSIQYKVKDAIEAGIHPLYALGAQTSGHAQAVAPQDTTGRDIGTSLANMGQNYAQKELHQKQSQLLDSQIRGNDANTALTMAKVKSLANPDQTNARSSPDISKTGKSLKTGMGDITFSPDWDSAQDASDRYGDIVEALYGIGVLGADAIESYKKWREKYTPYKSKGHRKTGRTLPSRR